MRACVFMRFYATRAQSKMKNSKKVFICSLSRIQKSKELCEEETRANEGERVVYLRLEFNTRQSLILFYYKFVLLQTASASASANK